MCSRAGRASDRRDSDAPERRPPARCVPSSGTRPRVLRARPRRSRRRRPGPAACSAASVFSVYSRAARAEWRAGARSARSATPARPRAASAPPGSLAASATITCEIGVGSECERCVGPLTLHWSHHTTSDREAGARTAGGVPEPRIKDAHLMRRHELVDVLAHSTGLFTDCLARASHCRGHNLRSMRRAVVRCSGRWRASGHDGARTALKGAMETCRWRGDARSEAQTARSEARALNLGRDDDAPIHTENAK